MKECGCKITECDKEIKDSFMKFLFVVALTNPSYDDDLFSKNPRVFDGYMI